VTEECLDELMNVHVKECNFLTQKIDLMNDVAASLTYPPVLPVLASHDYSAYASMKGAVEYYKNTLQGTGPRGIKANVIAPEQSQPIFRVVM